ncbi:hypothetical protein CULT_2230002 [[Clostridium] ultunense Esp]|nr:hypothetical protein CULT_2230002 [[Clostridium] ultunense Esp]
MLVINLMEGVEYEYIYYSYPQPDLYSVYISPCYAEKTAKANARCSCGG